MRVILMLLLLANLGVFAWLHWYGGNGAEMPASRPAGSLGKGLTLVGEAARDGRGDGEMTSSAPNDETPPQHPAAAEAPADAQCATVGPFDQLDIAEIARERLEDLGIQSVIRETGGQIRAGFWVHLPPFPNRNAARQVESELRARGVTDLFIVTASDQRNAISLGLFTSPERADQRAAEIGRLGFTPRVAERFRDATVYWLDFKEPAGDPLEPERIGVMGAGDTLPEKLEIPCGEIAVATGGA